MPHVLRVVATTVALTLLLACNSILGIDEAIPLSGVCALNPQADCGPNETCDLDAKTYKTLCVTAGTGDVGATCTSSNDCARGKVCGLGVCRDFCAVGTNQCGADASYCWHVEDNAGNRIDGAAVCVQECNIFTPAECGKGRNCMLLDSGTGGCGTAGPNVNGGACAHDTECAAGYFCNPFETEAVCRHWCMLDATASDYTDYCGSGLTCTAFKNANGDVLNNSIGYCL